MPEYKSGLVTTTMRAMLNKEHGINNLAYFLKSRTVEPEKQPLLENGSEKKHSFLHNDRETDNGTTSVDKQ
jgi:hypothetical protein